MSGPCQLLEHGPLVVHAVQRYRLGSSVMRLDMRLQADFLAELITIDWSQRHELLRLELPLVSPAVRYAADSAGTVLERPAMAHTSREQSRWEVPLISWLATQAKAPGGGLAVLLDGPQGVDVVPERIGVSLLRGPTWPDPGGSWLAPSATGADARQRHLEQGMRPSGGDRFPGAGMEWSSRWTSTIAAMVATSCRRTGARGAAPGGGWIGPSLSQSRTIPLPLGTEARLAREAPGGAAHTGHRTATGRTGRSAVVRSS